MLRNILSLLLFCLQFQPVWCAEEPVLFHDHVMAILSRAGCNQGACHGNLNGKGGFKLSLRGQDPDFDFSAITREQLGRRLDRLHPETSLLLLKATGAVAHEGGKRFDRSSAEYQLLKTWIASGASPQPTSAAQIVRMEVPPSIALVEPQDQLPLKIIGVFNNGERRNLTGLTSFELSQLNAEIDRNGVLHRKRFGSVTVLARYLDQQSAIVVDFVPARPEFRWTNPGINNRIDELVQERLKLVRLMPSPLAYDSQFLRRVYLDTLGILPTSDETRTFLKDSDPNKRNRLIDQLLERPEFSEYWALKWSDLLRNEEKTLDAKGVELFHGWLKRQIETGQPLNEMARELVKSRGSTYAQPEANYYRALRDPNSRAEAFAQVFLGIRIQCARCHNHPFDRWTQDDYHGLAAFFSRVQYRILENKRGDNLDGHEFKGEQVVWMDRSSELPHPRLKTPTPPRFPGEPQRKIPTSADRLLALADWLADPRNRFFARAQANRVWGHLMGRGLVDPLDDFRASNPASYSPLLDFLSEDFVAHQFDLRSLVRLILQSRTYQLSSLSNPDNAEDETGFSHALVRPLQAEQLHDAIAAMTGVPSRFPGHPPGLRAGQIPGVGISHERQTETTSGERFLAVFGKPKRSLSCECERSEDSTLSQAFQLLTGPHLNEKLALRENRLEDLLKNHRSPADICDECFLSTLSRYPTEMERAAAIKAWNEARDPRIFLEDLVWGLINSKEFLLRR